MGTGLVASASSTIGAPRDRVWHALVTPEKIERYMFGAKVASEWREGSRITWSGEWQGRAYEDKGVILRFEPPRVLQYTHFSPLSGLQDTPENHHTVTIELSDEDGRTRVSLVQDNNATEQAREHSEKNWAVMLDGLKKLLER
ncbi:MAG TPA: SRPBCC family protein [bacterium]